MGLALAWIAVPAVQYFATWQRTAVLLDEPAPAPGLAGLDLTPLYALLVAGTAVFVLIRYLEHRRNSPGPRGPGQYAAECGGSAGAQPDAETETPVGHPSR